MKEKLLIWKGDPCRIRLDDLAIQTGADAQARGQSQCRYTQDRNKCSSSRFGCVQLVGLKVARYVLQFYSEATEETLAMEVENFRRNGPLPPNQLEAYVDTPDHGSRNITDPEVVVQRVADYARNVLDLKPGERVFRSSEEHLLYSSN